MISVMRSRSATVLALLTSAVLYLALGCGSNSGPKTPAVSGLTAVVNGHSVHLAWTRTDAVPVVKVLRRLNAAPEGATDPAASLVYAGPLLSADDALSGLLPAVPGEPRTYHYAAYGCDANGNCDSAGGTAAISPTLVECLRAGGYVLYWRHASATRCEDRLDLGSASETTVPDWWKSCGTDCGVVTAAQLDADGILEATAIGDGLRAKSIPIGRVVSSEFCRCLQTVDYMGLESPDQDSGITYFVYDEGARCEAVTAWLALVPAAGTNLAVVGHTDFMPACASIPADLEPGEAILYKPDGHGSSVRVARVRANEWAALP